ncbi:hypothetical protein [Spirosoma sordidisoli]|uniref:Uncharacterized protein n=1 Tax=Spirosoma sordidisoli TaxID=2502893 RepID=A0A4Q2UPJ7_9BACT|nr:hypothetical protein [Spirosoma sordidisoli]RYC71657.1 hypothetical protein EQG79_05865 [Spirosoma sordidisoli]
MKINSQKIYGGNQQFGDKIINNNSVFTDTDKKIIELLATDNSSTADRESIAKAIQQIKSNESNVEEKNQAKGFLKKLLEGTASQVTQGVIRELIESGASYLDLL